MRNLHYIAITPRMRLDMEFPRSYRELYKHSRQHQARLLREYRNKKLPEAIKVIVVVQENEL